MSYTIRIAAVAIVLAAFAPIPLAAQEGAAPPPQQEAPQVTLEDLGEHKVEAFASAYLDILDTATAYQDKLTATQDDLAESRRVQEEMRAEMVQAIKDEENLTLQEYNTIIAAMNSDQSIRQAVDREINRQREKDSEG